MSPRHKIEFLGLLRQTLSPDDEAFLEHILDTDKKHEIRFPAGQLLSVIPNSAHSKRMFDRLAPHICVRRSDTCVLDFDWSRFYFFNDVIRDGVSGSWTRYGAMPQMLGFVNPSRWVQHLQMSAVDLVLAARGTDPFGSSLSVDSIKGWAEAASLHKDRQFACALIKHGSDDSSAKRRSRIVVDNRPLVQLLPPGDREELIMQLIEENGGKIYYDPAPDFDGSCQIIAELLKYSEHAWSKKFSQRILCLLKEQTDYRHEHFNWSMRFVLPQIGLYLSPDLFDEVAVGWIKASQVWADLEKPFQSFIANLNRRASFRAALAGNE